MQERSDEVRAKYYTEDTPLTEVDETLSDGGFTGFVELSENVLSGDYYVVYHGGRSMSVAFVGERSKLEADDEAFDLASDEVGIYEVRPVPIDIIELPEPEPEPDDESADDEPTTAVADPTEEADTDVESATDADGPTAEESTEDEGEPESSSDDEVTADADAEEVESDAADAGSEADAADEAEQAAEGDDLDADAEDDEAEDDDAESTATDDDSASESEDQRRDGIAETDADGTETEVDDAVPDDETVTDVDDDDRHSESTDVGETAGRASADESATDTVSDAPASTADGTNEPADHGADPLTPTSTPDRRSSGSDAGVPSPDPLQDDAPFRGDNLEIRSVPSLDPERTSVPRDEEPATAPPASESATQQQHTPAEQSQRPAPNGTNSSSGAPVQETPPDESGEDAETAVASQTAAASSSGPEREVSDPNPELEAELDDLKTELAERERELDALESDLLDVEAERDDVADERDALEAELTDVRDERDELRAEVEELESKLETLERKLDVEASTVAAGERNLSPSEALQGTNLFVRYESKGQPTLESAHSERADKGEVNQNLELNYHTTFEAAETTVDGKPYEEFLHESLEYRFVDWVVHELLYEIRDTNSIGEMEDLYDAIPRIDRAELDGGVSVTYSEDGQDQHGEETFDVVLRDRMGDPLVVADMNDSRLAASESMMSSLITSSSRVCGSKETLAAGVLVTRSFFEPEALEAASEATGGGLLSRDKRKSFVKLARKQGYHLCLAEARNDEFYLTVPEL
ncbi:hypothetical protein VB773_08515 [Haloarculaceae archaeon H-GB2-1]|nr:hypothetical protein [Haloarculaceae archaeon H-GB2-1]